MSDTIEFYWNGRAMIPTARFEREARNRYVNGDTYPMAVMNVASQKTKAHFFAILKLVYDNWPEDAALQFASIKHMRKKLLIDAGFYVKRVLNLQNQEIAEHVAARIRSDQDYAEVAVVDGVIEVRVARSLKDGPNGLTAEEFQTAKTAMFEMMAQVLGIPVADLTKEGIALAKPTREGRAEAQAQSQGKTHENPQEHGGIGRAAG